MYKKYLLVVLLLSICYSIPANAWGTEDRWYCNDGYKKVSGSCVKIEVPANAWVSGDRWYCNIGYKKYNNTCVEMSLEEKKIQLQRIAVAESYSQNTCSPTYEDSGKVIKEDVENNT